jgi:hypothetical protein
MKLYLKIVFLMLFSVSSTYTRTFDFSSWPNKLERVASIREQSRFPRIISQKEVEKHMELPTRHPLPYWTLVHMDKDKNLSFIHLCRSELIQYHVLLCGCFVSIGALIGGGLMYYFKSDKKENADEAEEQSNDGEADESGF